MTPKLLTLPVLAAAIPSGIAAADKTPERVNIVHIMSDDHSYQTLSAYGGPVSKLAPTPNLDRLAERGMIFQRAYVENSISTPSRAAHLTGKYSHQNGQIKLGGRTFSADQTTYPKLLQQAGYQTAVVGKWHLAVDPAGFDHYKILQGQGNYYAPEFRTEKTDGKYIREEKYVAEAITDSAIEWLEGRDKNEPFCLLVHHKSVHRNWFPEDKYVSLYQDVNFPEPPTLFDDYATRSDAARTQMLSVTNDMQMAGDLKVWQMTGPGDAEAAFLKEFSRMTPEQQRAYKEAYRAENEAFIAANPTGAELTRWKYQRYIKEYVRCVRSLDDQIGRLIDYLDKNGLSENTVIVYTSDQGFYMGEHDWFDKRFMYEESFRTPLIISYPEKIKPGTVCDALVQNIDFAPTYLALAGVEVPDEMWGVPLLPLFETGKAPRDWRDELYYHYYDYPGGHNVRRHDGVLTQDFKLIHFKDEGGGHGGKDTPIDAWELYDLRKDPTEVNNVYDDPRYATIRVVMEKRLADKRVELNVDESIWDLEAWKRNRN
jgi:arylsulfatase A-like enzyme